MEALLARLESVKSRLHSTAAVDTLPINVSAQKIGEVLNHNQNESGGLEGVLDIEVEARIMLILNVDLHERLLSGQLRVVKHMLTDTKGNIMKN